MLRTERHTYPKQPSKKGHSYAELAEPRLEPGTFRSVVQSSTDWAPGLVGTIMKNLVTQERVLLDQPRKRVDAWRF